MQRLPNLSMSRPTKLRFHEAAIYLSISSSRVETYDLLILFILQTFAISFQFRTTHIHMSFFVQQRAHIRPGKIKLADCLGYDRYDMYRFQGGGRHEDIRGVENDSSFLFKNTCRPRAAVPHPANYVCCQALGKPASVRFGNLADRVSFSISDIICTRQENPSRACRCISIVYHLLVWGVLPEKRLVRLIDDALQVTGNTDRPGGYSSSMF